MTSIDLPPLPMQTINHESRPLYSVVQMYGYARDAAAIAWDAAYEAGWRNAASWAQRGDLVHDIGSPAYERERDAARGGA